MLTKRNLLLIIGVVILLLILVGGYIVYTMMGDYIIYTVKTLGKTKHKLTVYAEYLTTGNPAEYTSIEVVQRINSAEKIITYRKTNRNGVAVFSLLPGEYYCQGRGIHMGYTDFINLNKDKDVRIKIWILIQ